MDQSKHEKHPRRVGEDRNAGTRRNEEEIGKPVELEGEREGSKQGGQQHQGGHQQQGGQQRKPESERRPDQGQPTGG